MNNDIFERLKALQEILARKNELEMEILDAPKALNTREELLERLKSEYIEKNTDYEELLKNAAIPLNPLKLSFLYVPFLGRLLLYSDCSKALPDKLSKSAKPPISESSKKASCSSVKSDSS